MKFKDIKWPHDSSMPWLKKRIIFLTKHGSQAYGTSTPTSDLDIKGVAIPPQPYFLGFTKKFEQAESKDPDMVIYDVRKFIDLASDCNPSIIEILWTDPSDHLVDTVLGGWLLKERASFLTKKARFTFSGYAIGQLRRIQNHYNWLKNPPKQKPTRKDFRLPDKALIPANEKTATEGALYRERAYVKANKVWNQYQEWKLNRNPARAALEEKYGYDTKHAMHLVRLMRMCEEILTQHKVLVKRPDAEELLAIRNGAWTYEQLIEYAAKKDLDLEAAYQKCTLPDAPNRDELDEVCMNLTRYGTMGPSDLMNDDIR